jgi:hypothetical protein
LQSDDLQSSNDGDFIEQSAAAEFADTATNRMLSMIHKKVAEHRDALGYPIGKNDFPGFYVTNDLSSKFGQAMKLFVESDIDLSANWVLELARNFVGSYDDKDPGFHHSAPRATAVKVLEQYEAVRKST